MADKSLFFDLDRAQLKEYFLSIGEPAYRVNQVWQAFYAHLANSPDQLSAIPKALREKLRGEFDFQHLTVSDRLASSDGETVKTLFLLPDGLKIETVYMRYEERQSICVSTQAGCAMGCVFCATGQMGFHRNLSSGEIVEQVLHFARELAAHDQKVTNIVLMGMGEPFHNYDAVMAAIHRLNDPEGMNLGMRRFTISTVGIVPMIRRFAAENSQVNLAISLHAANDKLRSSLLPVNKKYPLVELLKACRDYVSTTNRRITLEWALIQDVNDSTQDAQELVNLVKGMLCHVNLIPLNPTRAYTGKAANQQRANDFKRVLDNTGIPCTIRLRRGIDIQAGCGQLAARQS
jgi:23S rRNA (adenine2503-C2)-methyltransferase